MNHNKLHLWKHILFIIVLFLLFPVNFIIFYNLWIQLFYLFFLEGYKCKMVSTTFYISFGHKYEP